MSEDIVYMIKYQPFHSKIILQTTKVFLSEKECERSQIPVAAVNIKNAVVHLYINPEGYLSLSRKERVGVLIHEMMHIELGHLFRMEGKNLQLYNIATDLAINQLIPDNEKISLPESAVNIQNVKKLFGVDYIPAKKNADYYYHFFEEILKNNDSAITEDLFQERINNFSEEMLESAGSSPDKKNRGKGEIVNWHQKWQESEGATKINEAIVKEMVKQALKRDPGTIPGELQTEIQDWLTPQVDWRAIFNRYAAKYINLDKKSTWKKENRRNKLIKGYRRNKKWKVFVGVDTSASISDEDLQKFASEIKGMHERGADITVIECDMDVRQVYKFNGKIDTLKFKGRGGTSFVPVFEMVKKEKQVDLVIYLTDGGGEAPKNFKIPTIWVITPDGSLPYDSSGNEIKWGKEIKLN